MTRQSTRSRGRCTTRHHNATQHSTSAQHELVCDRCHTAWASGAHGWVPAGHPRLRLGGRGWLNPSTRTHKLRARVATKQPGSGVRVQITRTWKRTRNKLGCVSHDSPQRESILWENGNLGSNFTMKFSKHTWHHSEKVEPQERSPCAPRFEEVTQERCACGVA